jgi:hypothetical protein
LAERVSALGLATSDVSLDALLKEHVASSIAGHEATDIAAHPPRYAEWQQHRSAYLQGELEAQRVAEKKREMMERILELRARDEKLRFFEQADRIELGIASKTSKEAPEKVGKEEVFVAAPGERGRGVA